MALLAAEARCEEFKAQFAKYDFLWKRDMQAALQVGGRTGVAAGPAAGSWDTTVPCACLLATPGMKQQQVSFEII